MTEVERQAVFDECFEHNGAPTDILLPKCRFSLRTPR
jgi:hypothetical protein